MGRSHPLLPSRQSDCSLHLPANRQSTHPQSASDRTTLRASAPPSPPTKADGTQPPTPSISTIRLQPSPTSEPAIYSPSVCLRSDNTESVRAPFTSYEGRWDAATHSFHLDNQTAAFTYQRTGNLLTLSLPPIGQH